ncbi:hypothetical protein PROFUN_12538 [Planoprotostelium fungivorum]|uniref:Uncharacterized protein n=1 Tax=Planoprotostelium fungivorum TaxID=1890364 RepID=A0A2P6MS51_9EUKA|nr:hypothetical protein PROFUN_12538 [Planoprotostelium fungivorum]
MAEDWGTFQQNAYKNSSARPTNQNGIQDIGLQIFTLTEIQNRINLEWICHLMRINSRKTAEPLLVNFEIEGQIDSLDGCIEWLHDKGLWGQEYSFFSTQKKCKGEAKKEVEKYYWLLSNQDEASKLFNGNDQDISGYTWPKFAAVIHHSVRLGKDLKSSCPMATLKSRLCIDPNGSRIIYSLQDHCWMKYTSLTSVIILLLTLMNLSLLDSVLAVGEEKAGGEEAAGEEEGRWPQLTQLLFIASDDWGVLSHLSTHTNGTAELQDLFTVYGRSHSSN